MVMVVKKKIPLAIIRTLLDYGMHTKFMPAAFNDYWRARERMPDFRAVMQNIAQDDANPVSSFMIAPWHDHYYDDYFHQGDEHGNPMWGVTDFGKTGGIHFIIKQYAFGCLDTTQHVDLLGGGTIKPGMEQDYKYYTDLLKLIFRRHCRIVGEEGAVGIQGEPIIPGIRYVPNAIMDSPAYQNIYKQYFPRLTAIAQSTIDEYAAIVEKNRAIMGGDDNDDSDGYVDEAAIERLQEHDNAMAVEHGPAAAWDHDGGRRKHKTIRKRRKRRRTRRKRRKRKKRSGGRRKKTRRRTRKKHGLV